MAVASQGVRPSWLVGGNVGGHASTVPSLPVHEEKRSHATWRQGVVNAILCTGRGQQQSPGRACKAVQSRRSDAPPSMQALAGPPRRRAGRLELGGWWEAATAKARPILMRAATRGSEFGATMEPSQR